MSKPLNKHSGAFCGHGVHCCLAGLVGSLLSCLGWVHALEWGGGVRVVGDWAGCPHVGVVDG